MDPLRVAVIGAGVTGLAAAYSLERQGSLPGGVPVETTLIEAGTTLGGKVQTDHVAGLHIERGPDALFLRSAYALDLLRNLGLEDQIVRANQEHRQAAILRQGRLYPLPAGMESGVPRRVWPLLRSGILSPRGKLRAGMEVLLPARESAGDEAIDTFVRRRFGAEVADRVAAPLLGGIYSGDTRQLSLRATLPHLSAWEREHRSLLLASWLGRLPVTAGGSGGASPFVTLRGGLSLLPSALAAQLKRTETRIGTRVQTVARAPGWGAGYFVRLSDGSELRVDRVIVTVPAFAAAHILSELSSDLAAQLSAIHYTSVIVVALAFEQGSVTLPPGSGFVVAPGESSALSACSWSSHKWPHTAPAGHALVRAHLHPDEGSGLLDQTDAALVALVRAELGTHVGLRTAPAIARVYRWPRGLAAYTLGHRERLTAIENGLAAYPGLALAGAGYRGAGIPECLRQGVEAARSVLNEVGNPAFTSRREVVTSQ